MSKPASEKELVGRLQSGDVSALDELYDVYTPLLYGVALRVLKNRVEAEEVVQDAWVYAWKTAKSFDAERGSFSGWLVMITRSRALDRYRSVSSRRQAEEQVEVEETGGDDPAQTTALNQLSEQMQGSLNRLKPDQRRAIEIAFFEGLSHSEVAERMDKPLGTVKTWIREGLQRLSRDFPREGWT